MTMAKLDIIVTHYDEDWEIGKKFFDMLALQHGIDFRDFRVILMHDGTGVYPKKFFDGYPYEVIQKSIRHAGVSAARNKGMQIAEAPWICFCDFDDMFSGIYSLRNVLSALPEEGYDILWTEFYSEDRKKTGELVLHLRKENSVFIHGKYFRRAFLAEHDLWFPEDQIFNEDSCFCTIAFAIADYRRVGHIVADAPIYAWVFRPGSITATQENRAKALVGLYERNKKVVDAFRKYVVRERYLTMVCRASFDAYHMLNVKELPEELVPILEDFRKTWPEWKADFLACPAELRKEAMRASRKEREHGDMEEIERWGKSGGMELDRTKKFADWIREIEGK